jgi:hypothetical protein
MKQVFRAHRLCRQDGPLGPYIDSYEAEMRCAGYARQTREVQIRLVADFGGWLANRGIQAQDITAELFRPYLRARARRRRPTGNDLSALQRLLELLRRQGVIAAALSPAATPAERLQSEFRLYLRQERALASATQACYTAFVSEFLTERFGAPAPPLPIRSLPPNRDLTDARPRPCCKLGRPDSAQASSYSPGWSGIT